MTKFTETSTGSLLISVRDADPAPDPLTRKLRGFADVQHGWSHGEGVGVTPEVIRVAETFVEIATRLQLRADVFPG